MRAGSIHNRTLWLWSGLLLAFCSATEFQKNMTCGLADEELFILNILYVNRCFTDKASFNLVIIASAFRAKFGVDPEDCAKDLMSKGYISQKRKI